MLEISILFMAVGTFVLAIVDRRDKARSAAKKPKGVVVVR